MASTTTLLAPPDATPDFSRAIREPASAQPARAAGGLRLPLLWGVAGLSGLALGLALGGESLAGRWFGALCLLSSAALLWRAMRAERRARQALQDFAVALGQGELIRRLDPDALPGQDLLCEQFNAMAHALSRVFIDLSRSTFELASVAQESSANAVGGDAGVRAQRDVTQSSAAALEELTAGLAVASDNARGMAGVAARSGELALAGQARVGQLAATLEVLSAAVKEAAEGVGRLDQRSREIGGIALLIGEIASRTNLLALNAAIEAARAGEQGRGFAVVADEVRKLSESTAQATRDIGERIAAVQTEVGAMDAAMEAVRSRTERSGEDAIAAVATLEEMSALADSTRQLASETAAAAAEQSAACQSIAQDIEAVAQLADRNERLTHDNSELARYLDQLGHQLAAAIEHFRYE